MSGLEIQRLRIWTVSALAEVRALRVPVLSVMCQVSSGSNRGKMSREFIQEECSDQCPNCRWKLRQLSDNKSVGGIRYIRSLLMVVTCNQSSVLHSTQSDLWPVAKRRFRHSPATPLDGENVLYPGSGRNYRPRRRNSFSTSLFCHSSSQFPFIVFPFVPIQQRPVPESNE